MWRRVIATALAIVMIVAGVLWTAEGNGWIGNTAPSRGAATLGPILAGLGVALAWVSLQRRRQR